MLLAGDELGRTQQGNNNTYCQDNELSWVDWQNADDALIGFTAELIHLRMHHATFRRRRYFQGKSLRGEDLKWLDPNGEEMTPEAWADPAARCVGAVFTAAGFDKLNHRGEPILDDDFLLILNAHYEPIEFRLPDASWSVLVDTSRKPDSVSPQRVEGDRYVAEGRSLALLTRTPA